MGKGKTKKLILASSYDEIEKVESFINDSVGVLNEALNSRIQLAVNEAVTNAVVHGNKLNSAQKVEVMAKIEKNTVVIWVQDEGKGFDAAAVPDPTEEDRLLNQGGRGVYLMQQYADEVTFEKQGTRVKMTFYR